MNIPDQSILRKTYEKYLPARTLLAKDIEGAIEAALKPFSSHLTIKGRVKEFGSYYNKYIKNCKKNAPNHPISDIIGIRIVCPFFEDINKIEELLKKGFNVLEIERKGANYSFKEFGYKSTHLLIKIPEKIIKNYKNCELEIVEIQIRTILQDAWAEVEHELVYKAEFTPFTDSVKHKLAALNATLSLADTIFQEIRNDQRKKKDESQMRRNLFLKGVEDPNDDLLNADADIDKIIELDNNSVDGILLKALSDHSIDELLTKALIAHNKRQFKKAIALYTCILSMNPNNNMVSSIVYGHRGMANFARSHYDEAILDFTKSLSSNPNYYKSAYYRGVVKSVLQCHSDAVDDFTVSIKINPYYASSFYRRARAYYHLNDFTQALADCESALSLESDSKEFQSFKELLLKKLNP